MLKHYASMTIKVLGERRHHKTSTETKETAIANIAHDLITPLTGLQLSLSLLQEDKNLAGKLDEHQNEILGTAMSCSDIMFRICHRSIETLRDTIEVRSSASAANDTVVVPVTKIQSLIDSLTTVRKLWVCNL